MPTKIELLQEAEKRGILPESKKALYAEALKRGLIKSQKSIIEEPEMGASHTQRIDTGLQPSHAQMTPDERFGGPKSKIVSEIARPIISGITGAGGAMIGTGAGPGFGTAIGGGLGYSIGEEIADKLDEFLGLKEPGPLQVELKKAITERTNLGAAYEVGGLAAAATLSPILKFGGKQISKIMPFSKAGAEVKAGKQLIAQTDNGPMVANNYEEAKELENLIPGLKFSRGQLTNDPSVVKWERSMLRMPGRAATGSAEQTAQNTDAIKNYITKAKGTGAIEDVTGALTTQREAAETGVTEAQKALERETIPGGVGIVEGGEQIRGAARTGKAEARKEASRLFEDVPEFEIDASKISSKIDELSQPMNRFEDIEGNVPKEFTRIKEALTETKGIATPQDLQGLRSTLTDTLRDAQGSASPNNKMISRISQLVDEVDGVLKEAGSYQPVKKKTVFHGTGVDFEDFDDSLRGTVTEARSAESAIWLTDDKDVAKAYAVHAAESGPIKAKYREAEKAEKIAQRSGKNEDWNKHDELMRQAEELDDYTATHERRKGATVKEFTLDGDYLKVDAKGKTPQDLSEEYDIDSWLNDQIKVAKNIGKDGVIIQNLDDAVGLTDRPSTHYAIFDKKNIKVVKDGELPTPEAAKKLKTAQQYFKKEVIEKFSQGTVGDILKKGAKGDKVGNAQVASRFFKPGPAGVQQADDFLNTVGDNPEAKQAMEDFIKQDLLNYSTNPVTGEVTQTKLKTWLTKYKPSLKKYGMEKRFDSIVKARTELDDALLFKKEFDKSQASKLLNSDVDKAVLNAFSEGSKGEAARKLMNTLKGDKQGISGLQNSVIDHILYKDIVEQTPRTISKVSDQYLKYKAAFPILFKDSPSKLKALKTYRNALDKMEILNRSPIGPGSATMELQETGKAIEAATGLSKNWIYTVGKTIANITKGNSDKAVKMLLHRAAYDPDFAFTLMLAAKGRSKDVIKQRLYGHLTAMGLRGTIKKEK